MSIEFTTELLPEALRIMGLGMAGIFIALFIIYVACVGLKKIFPEKKDD